MVLRRIHGFYSHFETVHFGRVISRNGRYPDKSRSFINLFQRFIFKQVMGSVNKFFVLGDMKNSRFVHKGPLYDQLNATHNKQQADGLWGIHRLR